MEVRKILAAVLAACIVLGGCTGSSDSGTELTCSYFRDIARDAADGVDTLDETRERLKDLLDGYGLTAADDVRAALRAVVAALTSDLDAAAGAVTRMGAACSRHGF
jgi:hypothetical protein